jgi:hypothetical protein
VASHVPSGGMSSQPPAQGCEIAMKRRRASSPLCEEPDRCHNRPTPNAERRRT